MKISIDKLKLCYTLYEDSPLYQLMETPLEIYELPHWDFRLDLAFDDTRNLSKRLIRAIRDEALIPIVNGTKITDRDKLLEDILYIGIGSCRRIKEYSLIVQHKNGDLRLSAYNKKREIESNSGKQYIAEANGNPKHLSRLEIRINGDVLNEWFNRERIEYNPLLFCNEDFLLLMFLTFSSRVLRFQTAKGRQSLDVLDIVA